MVLMQLESEAMTLAMLVFNGTACTLVTVTNSKNNQNKNKNTWFALTLALQGDTSDSELVKYVQLEELVPPQPIDTERI